MPESNVSSNVRYLPDVSPVELRQSELVDLVSRFAPEDGRHETAIGALQLIRASQPAQRLPTVYEPGIALVVQGRKQAMAMGEVLTYDPLHCLVVSVPMPSVGQILDATPEKPYLCVRLGIEPREIGSLILESGAPAVPPQKAPRGLQLWRVSASLLDAVLRLLRLLTTPDDLPVLAPMAVREIYYRVLTGDLGPRLRELATADSHAQRISRAIDLLQRRYDETVRVEELAESVHMSPSSLHHHFKQVTAMSPLQFQKQLRLHQARRLMLTDGIDAAAAAHRVGYESPSQFSREYRRLFGAPPKAEIEQVRAGAV